MLGNPKPIREVRQRIVSLAQGKVLEIGVGPGVHFVHYDPARVSKLYALEPNPGMILLAAAAAVLCATLIVEGYRLESPVVVICLAIATAVLPIPPGPTTSTKR